MCMIIRIVPHPLADGILTRKQMKRAIVLIVLVDTTVGAFFAIIRGPLIILFAILGLALLLLYGCNLSLDFQPLQYWDGRYARIQQIPSKQSGAT